MDKAIKFISRLPSDLIKVVVALILTIIFLSVGISILQSFLGSWFDISGPISWAAEYIKSAPAAFWVVVITALLVATTIAKSPLKHVLFLATVALAAFWLSPFLGWAANSLDRGINHGDWSASSDYVPHVIGGTFRVPAGKQMTADITGKVRIPIPVHHCINVSPDGKFFISWDDSLSNAYIEPRSGGMERVTISALPASRC